MLSHSRDIGSGCFCPHLAGTAGEHSHILTEPLRRELQSLDGCQIRKDDLAEFRCGHVVFKRQHDGLNRVRTFRRQDLRAEQTIRIGVSDEFDQLFGFIH